MVKVGLAYERVDLHAKRARIFFQLHELDSASTEMTAAISILQAQDSGSLQPIYLSKAIFDESLGIIYEHDRRFDLAREAYGRALQEDLSFYAAHNRLAALELEQGDTTNALTDIDLAVQLEPRDPALRYRYAEVLVSARRDAEAAQQLKKAIVLDPYYGSPHLMLAMMSDVESYTDEAIAEYTAYVALAARSEPQLARIQGTTGEADRKQCINPTPLIMRSLRVFGTVALLGTLLAPQLHAQKLPPDTTVIRKRTTYEDLQMFSQVLNQIRVNHPDSVEATISSWPRWRGWCTRPIRTRS